MDSTQKLLSDIQKIRKHYRAEHPDFTAASADELCRQIARLFERTNRHAIDLAAPFADYWYNRYIKNSPEPQNEPTALHEQKLAAMQSLLDNDMEGTEVLEPEDWKELCAITSAQAQDLDLDLLNSLMSVFVDKQAL